MSDAAPLTLDELHEAFEFLEDWEDRYRFIMDLGRKLPPLPEEERIDENLVHGCQSTVWVSATAPGGPAAPIVLHADSDSDLVKGLAAMVIIMLSGKGPADVATCDIDAGFERFGLHSHLSPTRSNGLHGMVRQVKSRAAVLSSG